MPKLTDLVPIPALANRGVEPSGNSFMLAQLGRPREQFTKDCEDVTNPALAARILREDVGPFRVRGWAPAVHSLREVMTDIRAEQPEAYKALGTAGMLCARLVRGSRTAISNHSWGTAIDLTLAGQLDARGNGRVQFGLTLIAPIFNRHGWYWGAGFRTEDAMHFECGRALILKLLGRISTFAELTTIGLGDRGPRVVELQKRLGVQADGIFGKGTEVALKMFQAAHGLTADGVAGPKTMATLNAPKAA